MPVKLKVMIFQNDTYERLFINILITRAFLILTTLRSERFILIAGITSVFLLNCRI